MYIYQPKRETKAHIVIPVFLIVVFLVAVAGAKSGISVFPALLQLVAVLSITVAIHVISRYSLSAFTYEADSEKRVLNIRKLTGKKIQLVAALDYDDIVAVDKKIKDYSLKEKYNKVYKVHNFCNNIFPAECYCLVCDVAGEDIAVVIEPDKKLLEILEARKNGN